MKLFICKRCMDMLSVLPELRTCNCGLSSARYITEERAEFFGHAMPIGLGNHERALLVTRQIESAPIFIYSDHFWSANVILHDDASLVFEDRDFEYHKEQVRKKKEEEDVRLHSDDQRGTGEPQHPTDTNGTDIS